MHKPSNGAMGVFRVLVCRVQSRWCGLPLDAVEETLRPQPLRPLASPPVHVQGLARIRGDWVPVAAAMDCPRLARGSYSRWSASHGR